MTTVYTRTRRASASARSLADIRVGDAMHRGVVTCDRDASLALVARVMSAHRIHAVVVRSGDEPGSWGIVSDLDVLEGVCAGALAEPIGTRIPTRTTTVTSTDTLERAARLMRDRREGHVVVLDAASLTPIGVLSTLDVSDAVAELAPPAAHDRERP